mgnify:CR=1 FL=1
MGIAQINSDNPNAPEHGKGYKHENHAGCPCRVIIDTAGACATIVQRFTRYDQSADLVTETECDRCDTPAVAPCPSVPGTTCGSPVC